VAWRLLDLDTDSRQAPFEVRRVARRSRKVGVWLALLGAGPLLVVGAASFTRRVTAAEPDLGVEWVQASAGPLALDVRPDSPAAVAGIRPGDVLAEVAGRPVESALDASELAWHGRNRGPVEVVVERGGAALALEVAPRWDPRPEPYLYLAIVGLAFWVSGLFITAKWPTMRGAGVYSMLSMAAFAQLTFSPSGAADWLDRLVLWVDLAAAALVPALLLHLGMVVSRSGSKRRRAVMSFVYLLAGLGLLFALWLRPETGGGVYRFGDPALALEVRDRLDPLWLSVCWVLTTLVLARSYRGSASVMHRSQMRWLLWGLGLGLGPFVVLYAVPWAVGANDLPGWAELLALAPMLVVPGAFTAALARYRLHDLDVFLIRMITEVAALFGTFAVLAASTFLLREAVADWLELSRSATRYVGFLIAALSYPQMRSWARTAVERAFYRKRYSYRATLLEWARELNAETDLPALLERLRERIRETLGIPQAAVLLGADGAFASSEGGAGSRLAVRLDAERVARLAREPFVELDAAGISDLAWARYLFPMRVKGKLRAVLAVAEREQPEEPLNSEDRALLGTLAEHAATAIEAARLFQEVRQRAEEIERLHSRQAKILESSAVGLALLDADGRILAWNRALEAIYGMGRAEALGRRLGDVFPLHVARRIDREARSSGPMDEARIFRLGMVNCLGNRILVNIAISPVGGASDGAKVITFDDVTERVKLEEQVARQERLASLGLLAAGVAHEINTPLTGISSYAQMLLDDPDLDERRRTVLERIEGQTRRAAGITTSLLNLARPESHVSDPVDLNAMVSEVLQLFEPQVRRTGVRVRSALADDVPPVLGNRSKLQQVVLNLLLNARDAVGERGNITVLTYFKNGKVVFEITDDGTGIAEEDLPRIFDPFFTTKGRGKGNGLGLSICYGIVQEHHGEIHVESSAGQYTRLRVELPAHGTAQALA
jgi:PAS domain S-box-containing protein